MNFIQRAWLYVTRKRLKSLLLLAILLIMAVFVLTALALGRAAGEAQRQLRTSMGGSFTISFNYEDSNPYLKAESMDGGTLIYSTQQITPELVERIRGMDGVKGCSATVETLAALPALDLIPGNIPIDQAFRQSAKLLGTWRSEELDRFTSGQLSLTQGRHILPGDRHKCMMSRDLADRNGLSLGERIRTDKGLEIEIVGLFSPASIEGVNDQVTAYDRIQNLIICDLATLIAQENGPALKGFDELMVSVSDPMLMDDVIARTRAIPDIDWNGFAIARDGDSYDAAAGSLERLSGIVSALLLAAFIVSTALLSLILTMWGRARVHETGVLLAMGMRKLSILGQYISEVIIIAALAFSLAYFPASALVCRAEAALTYDSANTEELRQDEMSAGVRDGQFQAADGAQALPSLSVAIDAQDMALMFLMGMGMSTVSACIAAISMMRSRPREILARMS